LPCFDAPGTPAFRHARNLPGHQRIITTMNTRWVGLAPILLVCLTACTPTGPPAAAPTSAAAPAVMPAVCAPALRTDELPEWARAGFSGDMRMPHVLGARGDIVAILFGYPLHHPPLDDGRTNKILWVSRVPVEPADTLRIEARLDATGPPVSREVPGGPGPSIVDLPAPGCWRLMLSWSQHTDTMDLAYQAR
jgi:hypothetical protein